MNKIQVTTNRSNFKYVYNSVSTRRYLSLQNRIKSCSSVCNGITKLLNFQTGLRKAPKGRLTAGYYCLNVFFELFRPSTFFMSF